MPDALKQTHDQWKEFDRLAVTGAIEEATGLALHANDPLPDTLIANAQAIGLHPGALRLWIYDDPKREDWSASAMSAWAARFGIRSG